MSITCREAAEALLEADGNPANNANQGAIAGHLDGCPSCRRSAARWIRWTEEARAAVPAPLPELELRRMERDLVQGLTNPPARPRRSVRRSTLLGVAAIGLAGLGLLVVRGVVPTTAPTTGGDGVVAAVVGEAFLHGRKVIAGQSIALGDVLSVAAGGGLELSLTLPTSSRVSVSGPAELALEGTATSLSLRLPQGTLHAEVAPLAAGQGFGVDLRDARVEVRGTAFTVGYDGSGRGWLEVAHGRVAVTHVERVARLVAPTDGRISLSPAPPALPPAAVAEAPRADGLRQILDDRPAPPAPGDLACAARERRCVARARAARLAIRRGDAGEASRLIEEGDAEGSGCARSSACHDELGYLRAEALKTAGQDEAALSAYRALGASGQRPHLRQNSLYAAGDLALRLGRPGDAFDAYERALAAAPRGALREEAMVGAFRAATAARDPRAAAAAARYLAAYPRGWAADEAVRVRSQLGDPAR